MPPLLILAKMIARSHVTKWRFQRGDIEADFGSTHQNKPVAASLDYIHQCFNEYRRYGGLQNLEGLEVLEGGPGDNFGVGALFLAHGARGYTGVDPFYSKQDTVQQHRIYAALREQLAVPERERFDQAIRLAEGRVEFTNRLRPVYGSGMGDFARLFEPASFDLIVSRAVMEQVYDVEEVFAGMDRVLKPGGLLLHKIDLSDYGIFSRHGHNPLTQLTLPDALYGCLAPNTGQLNRMNMGGYRKLMADMGYEAKLYVTSVIGPGYPQRGLDPYQLEIQKGRDYNGLETGLVESIRPRLLARYRSMSETDLVAAGVFLVARKKA